MVKKCPAGVEVNNALVFRYYNGVRRTLPGTLPQTAEKGGCQCPAPKGASDPTGLASRCPDTKPSFYAACLAIGLLSTLIGCYSGSHPTRIGSNAPDFTLQDSDHIVTLSQFRGQVVLLNFWATWCPPCVEETPSMVQMQTRLKDKGVVVLAVSIDDDDAAYHKFLKDYSVNMVTVRDEAKKTATLYGTFGWPETYVIDRNGVIRRKFIGPVDWNSPEVTDYLSKL